MSRIVVVGGFFTGEAALERIAEAGVEAGLADGIQDVITFPDAMRDPLSVTEATRGNVAVFHSAGNLATDYALDNGQGNAPEAIISACGVEPRHAARLVLGGVRRQFEFAYRGYLDGDEPDPQGCRLVAKDSLRESILNAHHYFPRVGQVSRFSTAARLNVSAERGIPTVRMVATDDHMYPKLHRTDVNELVSTVQHRGGHDSLLLRPQEMLGWVRNALGRRSWKA